MADKQMKLKFNEEVSSLKKKIEEVRKRIGVLESETGGAEIHVSRLRMASLYVDLVSIYCAMTDLSLNLLGFKNESYLDTGRKSIYHALIMLEKMVTNSVDMSLTENSEILEELASFSDADKLKLIRKIGYTISLLEDKYGSNSKWKWSFVELEGRYAVVSKNLFDFRNYQEKNDPREEGFDERNDYLFLVKELLDKASRRYREKYELTTHSMEDMKKAIEYLRALKRIHILFRENSDVQSVSKRIELWSHKLEADMKAHEKQMKMKKRSSLQKSSRTQSGK